MKEDQAWELKSNYREKYYDNRTIARQEEEKIWNDRFKASVNKKWSLEKRELLDGGQGKQRFFRQGGR